MGKIKIGAILFRRYLNNELVNEIDELWGLNILPCQRWQVIKRLQKLNYRLRQNNLTIIDLSTVKNTNATKYRGLAKIHELLSVDKTYVNEFKSLKTASAFPPPIVVRLNSQDYLLGGNKRCLLMVNKLKTTKIPVMWISI